MLADINELTCPECGSEIKSESRSAQHCNGHWNEVRSFDCGAELRFSPNYMRTEHAVPCPKNPAQVDLKKKQQAGRLNLNEFISALDVDAAFRQRILSALQYV
jgi:hypothetical protein